MNHPLELSRANLGVVWDRLDELFGSLDDDGWATQSLCPEWTVHGVAVHLGAVEAALVGWRPASPESHFFDGVGPQVERLSSLDGPALHAELSSIMSDRLAELDGLSADDAALPMASPVGPATYERFMAVRVFDWWVHEQDVRFPLGRRDEEGGPSAAQALDEIVGSMGYIVGKRIGLTEGGLEFRLAGPVERTLSVAIVDGRARNVDAVDDPVAVIETDSTTFALLACGRIDPDEPIGDGRITWSGDAEWGERAARNLRFTM